ncbi:hypothetical protein GCM10007885_37800 [Methylobacterium gnaphalii]|nr:hypothetical protein GCM10007885_37800 [Methylobacterium gnaphalii]
MPGVRVSYDESAAVTLHDKRRLFGIGSADPVELEAVMDLWRGDSR